MDAVKREIWITVQIIFSLFVSVRRRFFSGPNHFINFQIIFCIGMTLSLQIILNDKLGQHSSFPEIQERGDTLYYWKSPLNIKYSDYMKSVVYRLVIRPDKSRVTSCDRSAYDAHDRVGGLPVREIKLGQPLGDTNVHGISAVVDDRVQGRVYLRLLTVGLYPGPREGTLYCHYPCPSAPGGYCTSAVHGVLLLAGNHSSYPSDGHRKSFMDVASLACAVPTGEPHPTQVTLTSRSCGYAHNYMRVTPLERSTQSPPGGIAVCVRPISITTPDQKFTVPRFLEYWKQMGVDQVLLYYSEITERRKSLLSDSQTDSPRFMTAVDWSAIDRMTEKPVSDEAAVNHCVMNSMTSYRYVIVTSFDDVPVFLTNKYNDFKDIVEDPIFVKSIKEKSGFRITGPSENTTTFIMKTNDILVTAANHFVPLSAKASFQILHPFDVTMISMWLLWFQDDSELKLQELKKTVDAAVLRKVSMKQTV